MDDLDMDDDDDDDDTHLGGSLEESLKESNVTELKLSKRRLERKVRELQQVGGGGGGEKSQKVMVLQHLLDDSNRLKAQFEKNYLEVSQERDILQSDMARVREGIPDSILDESTHTMALRLHIIDLEKESKQLRDDMDKLERKMSDSRMAFTSDGIDNLEGLDEFKAQYKDMEQRSLLLEDQAKKQLQDINKLLLEKDTLQSQSIDQKDLLLEKERLYR
jgi:predicted  nucleic acid-binding Zn-ribbon protein